MKVACSTAGFTKLKLEDALKSIKELGFQYTDLLMMENWAHINPSSLVADPVSKAKWAGELLKVNGLKAIGINGNVSSPINTTDPERQRKNLGEMEGLAIFAKNLDIPVIVLQPGGVDPERGLAKSQEASINALKDMLKIAKKYDRELAIETHVNSVGEKYEDALKIVKFAPGLKLAYDPSHFVMQQMNLADSEPLID